MRITQVLTLVAALAIIVMAGPEVQAQCDPTQTITVGLAFVEFADADTDVRQRGGVGFTAKDQNGVRSIDPDKFAWQYWWNFFFQESGQAAHPDAIRIRTNNSATGQDCGP